MLHTLIKQINTNIFLLLNENMNTVVRMKKNKEVESDLLIFNLVLPTKKPTLFKEWVLKLFL